MATNFGRTQSCNEKNEKGAAPNVLRRVLEPPTGPAASDLDDRGGRYQVEIRRRRGLDPAERQPPRAVPPVRGSAGQQVVRERARLRERDEMTTAQHVRLDP